MSLARRAAAGSAASAATFLSTYFREVTLRGPALALGRLCDRLRVVSASVWTDCVRQLLEYDPRQGLELLESALSLHAADPMLLGLQGQMRMQAGDRKGAETAFRRALVLAPDHEDIAFAYARLLRDDARPRSAGLILSQLNRHSGSVHNAMASAEFLGGCGQSRQAYDICTAALAQDGATPALQLEAGSLALTIGEFDQAGTHLRSALNGQPPEYGATLPLAMSKRYTSADDPDLDLFRRIWTNLTIPDSLRLVTGFALGKALDDLGDFARAADALRAANELAQSEQPWSPRNWHDFVDIQLRLEPAVLPVRDHDGTVPVFIVGLPRTGTTLVAELLSRHPDVCNRGEMNWISFLAEQLAIGRGFHDRHALAQAADLYLRQLRQDDAPSRFYIDKNPLNFRHVGLIAALFPNARIIHCCRDPRDTALSIWSQLFEHPENAYSYCFKHISALMQGHDRLMAGLVPRLRLPVHRLQYETLVSNPDAVLAGLSEFVGLGSDSLMSRAPKAQREIGTASVWQARQPIYARGVGRWINYAPYLPELAELFADSVATETRLLTSSPVR